MRKAILTRLKIANTILCRQYVEQRCLC